MGLPPRVFLSYARKDGEEFATALRRRLAAEEPEITLWQDRAELEGGVGWWTQIEAALDQVKFLVVVMTPLAMVSEITRREWRYARQRGVNVYPVKAVPDDQLDYDALPSWMRKAHFFDLGRWTEAAWQDVKEWDTFVHYLKSDRQPVRVPFLAPDLPPGFVSRAREFDQVLDHLLDPARTHQLAITTALQGAGGYGKTTLASAVCHDERVIEAFDDGVLWTSLGQTPRVVDELARWYDALTGLRPAFIDERDAAIKLADKLEHRDCLLVIDDVWQRDHLEPFLHAGRHNARLITTRRIGVVQDAAHVLVDEMTAAESVRLLEMPFAAEAVALPRIAALTRRLGEWPLLLTLAAAMIRMRLALGDSADGALTYVERALHKRGVTAFDCSDTSRRDEAVRRTVAASLDQLSTEDGQRFQELAIFPEETEIPLTTLACLWESDHLDTEECAQRLHAVALLATDLGRGVLTLHGVMRTYLQHAIADLQPVHARLVDVYREWQHLPDGYSWRWLPYHLAGAGRLDALRTLLLTPTWLAAQLRAVGPYAVLHAFQWLPDDPDVEMVHSAVRLSVPAIASDSAQLGEQVWGRLPSDASATLDDVGRLSLDMAPVPRLHARWPNLERPTGPLRQTFLDERGVLGALVLPDRKVLSWGGEKTLRVWNLGTGEGRSLTGHDGSVSGALLLPDGRVLSWSWDRTLRVWDLETGAARALTGHEDQVVGALVLPDGRVLSWSGDQTLRVWDLGTGEVRALTGHEAWVMGALVLPDGRVVSWSLDGTLRVWDLGTGEGRPLSGHAGSVTATQVLPDGRLLSWGRDGTLKLWDFGAADGRPLTGHDGGISGALVLPDRRILSWGMDRSVRCQTTDGGVPALGFWFDAAPTVVVPVGADEFFVGDALGRVHVLQELRATQ